MNLLFSMIQFKKLCENLPKIEKHPPDSMII